MSEEILAIMGTLFIFVLMWVVVLAQKCSAMSKDIEQLYDLNARMSKVIAEHEEKIDLLGRNTEPEESENEDLTNAQKTLDERYNEGMDNIFAYAVNSGIRVVDR